MSLKFEFQTLLYSDFYLFEMQRLIFEMHRLTVLAQKFNDYSLNFEF